MWGGSTGLRQFQHGSLTGPARPDRFENGSCLTRHGEHDLRLPPLYPRSSGEEPPASNRQVEGATPSGDAFAASVARHSNVEGHGAELDFGKSSYVHGTQSGQARRGLLLTGSCRRQSGMGCKSSVFRHFSIRPRSGPPFSITNFPPCRPIRQDTWLSTRRPGGRSRRGGHFLLR